MSQDQKWPLQPPSLSFYDEAISELRIVGGEPVESQVYPWICSLQKGSHYCGGALIGSRHVLCAKHCLRMTRTPTVKIGGTDLNKHSDFVERTVVQTHDHPQTDACILVLNEPVEVTPVQLNSNDRLPAGSDVIAIGFGRTSETGPPSPKLMQVTLKLQTQSTCTSINGPSKFNPRFEICAGVIETGGKDACAGDSGGPLIMSRSQLDGRGQAHIGITSYGVGCARRHRAGVWVRTSSIKDWIAQIVPDATFVDAYALVTQPSLDAAFLSSASFKKPITDFSKVQPPKAPAPVQSAPVAPAPVQSAPVAPAPVQSAPVAPAPAPQVIQVQIQPQLIDSIPIYYNQYIGDAVVFREFNTAADTKPSDFDIHDTWPLILLLASIAIVIFVTTVMRHTRLKLGFSRIRS